MIVRPSQPAPGIRAAAAARASGFTTKTAITAVSASTIAGVRIHGSSTNTEQQHAADGREEQHQAREPGRGPLVPDAVSDSRPLTEPGR
jgi:hypothetical protein